MGLPVYSWATGPPRPLSPFPVLNTQEDEEVSSALTYNINMPLQSDHLPFVPWSRGPSPNAFLNSVETDFQRVLKYENPDLINQARALIPIETLKTRSINRMRNIQADIKKGISDGPEMILEEGLLLELMNWFNKSFFHWMDTPPCKVCSGATKYQNNTTTLSSFETIRVEIFKCLKCQGDTEFPRYNDPGILLVTKKGRCGEWANCFALMCRALDYDTRFVVDTTDHVWIEIYSHTKKRWLHCDPCENVLDSPLLYEAGWGKQLEYVMAYSRDDIQDVTWRYSSDHKAVLRRRTKCREQELVELIMGLRKQRMQLVSEVRRNFIIKRLCAEIVELMVERTTSSYEKVGRSSGSQIWRLQRQELRPWAPHLWELGEHREILIRYSTCKDLYEVVLSNGKVMDYKEQWMNGAFALENMYRKEENDWKMVYLTREENTEKAAITWKIISIRSMVIDSINIKASSKTYESGKIDWILCYADNCIKVPTSETTNFTVSGLNNVSEFTISATLTGGNGNCAWQHTQIFRQATSSSDYPFQIKVTFKLDQRK